MISMGLAAITAVTTFFLGYAVGSLFEHHKSQWEINVLTKVIEGCCKEDAVNVSETSRSS